ncbi:aminoglycoside phosphotransferase (APT) family kinase protein [Catenuloplanes nepalensis]|uniref:Aminoglycoside phosphotransferase (APT) family kinase protein n=1 Tax=Catenuloplanes nepalensis TaxID=587533 RepID=A0ABT9MM02_9ACTN|nr:phosphotransferase [Catenuloplanes nepalensis]MDP9792455.1 aminoglycoside phosphotransferase (APT) family kinase protein [Catenuloplanes nepalensis]
MNLTRLRWSDIPDSLRNRAEQAVATPLHEIASAPGGFTPGVASTVAGESGTRFFVKAIARHTSEVAGAYLREARIAEALPPQTPSPRLLWWHDDGTWIVMLFEHVDGHTPGIADLDPAMTAVAALGKTPGPLGLPRLVDEFAEDFTGWRDIADAASWTAITAAYPELASTSIDVLAAREKRWTDAADGTALVHGDLRLDNMILAADGVRIVDWPNACTGAGWVDLVLMTPSLAMHGVDVEQLLDGHPLTREADRDDLDTILVAGAGYFVSRSLLPPPPAAPAVRDFQQAQAKALLAWLRTRRPDILTDRA